MTICDFLLNVRETSKIFIFTVTEINPGVRRQVSSSHVRLLLNIPVSRQYPSFHVHLRPPVSRQWYMPSWNRWLLLIALQLSKWN